MTILPAHSYDTITLIDVVYYLTPDELRETLRWCWGHLNLGGRMLITTMDGMPKWKFRLLVVQEWLMVRVLRLTQAHALWFPPLSFNPDIFKSVSHKLPGFYPHRLWVVEK